jgi:acetyltransferase
LHLTLLLSYIPGITSDVGARLSEISYISGESLVAYVPHVERYRMLIEGFELNGIPVSLSIHNAILMVQTLKKYRKIPKGA